MPTPQELEADPTEAETVHDEVGQADGFRGEAAGARVPPGAVVFRPGMTMEEMERGAIVSALDSVNGNRRKAAELLGIGERTLYRKISKYGLDS